MTRLLVPLCAVMTCVLVDPARTAAADLVPFHSTIQTQPAITGACGATCLTLDIPGFGNASHMGRIVAQGASQIDVGTLVQSGMFVLTAANGDKIVMTFVGTFLPETPGNPAGPVTFEGIWIVVSGTGRFTGAVGGGNYEGSAEGPNGILYLTGAISSPGANKR